MTKRGKKDITKVEKTEAGLAKTNEVARVFNQSQKELTESEKFALCAALYVTVSEEQLEKEKVKGSEKPREMSPEEMKDFRERCAKAVAEVEKDARAIELDYVGETLKFRREARAWAIARNEIVEGDEVQLKEKIRNFRGQGIVPLFDWVLAEGLSGRVEALFPGDEVRPGWWEAEGSDKRRPSPPYALVVYPDLYVFYNPKSSEVEVKEIEPYDCVNKLGELVRCNTIEECKNPNLVGFAVNEESVLVDGVEHTVLQEEDCEVLIPTHWLEHKK